MGILRTSVVAVAIASFLSLASAQQSAPTTSKYEPALDVTSMDRTVDPCTDFFQYSCAGWIKHNPIPPDQSSWSLYAKMQDENRMRLRGILEAAAVPDPKRDADEQKIGDYYASCMDEKAIDAKAAEPLQPELEKVAQLKAKDDLAEIAASMRGNNVLFGFGSTQDYRDASQVIAEASQGGLGLPDRDYYLKEDAKSVDLRKAYVAHVQKMFELLGDKPDVAAAEAQTVMRIETALAKGSMTRVEQRDPKNLDHKLTGMELEKASPDFAWTVFFTKVGLPSLGSLNVTSPTFFKAMNEEIAKESLADWKVYLRWHLVHADAPYLSSAFVNENFAFYGKTLRGQQELQPRWKEGLLLLGVKHVQDDPDQERVARLLPMVPALERPFRVHQDVRDVLDVADLVRPLAHLEERVVAGRARVGRVEQEAVGEAATPAGRELPVLALDVVHNGRAGPGEQRRDHQADALAGARGCEGHHMLGAVVAEIPVAKPPEEDACRVEQPSPLDLLPVGPARRAVGGDQPILPRPPQRADDGDDNACKSARRRDHGGLVEDRRCVSVVGVPPFEEAPGVIDRPGQDREPGQAETRLVGELGSGPFGRHPQAADHHREDD